MTTVKISLRIIAIFTVAIFISKIPDLYPSFFGDWYCDGSGEFKNSHFEFCNYDLEYHKKEWHWGYQHYLFFLMGLALSVIQIIDIIHLIHKDNENK